MRKALVAGAAGVAAVAAFVLTPEVWSQERRTIEKGDRRVVMLDGRGSTIGVSIRDLAPDDVARAKLDRAGGVVIETVNEESPAERAGLREGDIIVEFDGERVRSARQLARLVQETPDGRSVRTTVVRDGARQTVDVTPERGGRFAADFALPNIAHDIEREVERGIAALPRNFAFDLKWDGELPAARLWPMGRFGVQVSPLTDQLAEYFGVSRGVLVSSVQSDSPAAKAGLKAGDVITSVNGRTVETPRDVTQELRDAEPGQEVEIDVTRDRKKVSLKAPVPERRRVDPRRPTRPA